MIPVISPLNISSAIFYTPMYAENMLQCLLVISLIVIILRQMYYVPTTVSLIQSFSSFTFGLMDGEQSTALLIIISLIIPIYIMIYVFCHIYQDSMSLTAIMSDIISKHVIYGYLTLSIIYSIDLIEDYQFGFENQKQITNYNPHHKYILHFIFTPIMFVDAIYSIEIETIKQKDDKDEKRRKDRMVYFGMQIIMACYVLYGLLIVLHLDGHFKIENKTMIFPVTKIKENVPEYLHVLFKYIMICLLVPLSTGLIDQSSNIGKSYLFRLVYYWLDED